MPVSHQTSGQDQRQLQFNRNFELTEFDIMRFYCMNSGSAYIH